MCGRVLGIGRWPLGDLAITKYCCLGNFNEGNSSLTLLEAEQSYIKVPASLVHSAVCSFDLGLEAIHYALILGLLFWRGERKGKGKIWSARDSIDWETKSQRQKNTNSSISSVTRTLLARPLLILSAHRPIFQ